MIDSSSNQKEPRLSQIAKLLIKENIRQKAMNKSNLLATNFRPRHRAFAVKCAPFTHSQPFGQLGLRPEVVSRACGDPLTLKGQTHPSGVPYEASLRKVTVQIPN